jgi:hypothetical protein
LLIQPFDVLGTQEPPSAAVLPPEEVLLPPLLPVLAPLPLPPLL